MHPVMLYGIDGVAGVAYRHVLRRVRVVPCESGVVQTNSPSWTVSK